MTKRKVGRPPGHPKVICIETGECFESFSEAGRALGCDRKNIQRCAEGLQHTCKGYHVMYEIPYSHYDK